MSNRIEVANELRVVLGRHGDRAETTLSIAVSVGESLRRIFDEYVRKELDDLRSQIQLLQRVGRQLEGEENKLNDIEERFEEKSDRLNQMLSLAKEGKIKSLSWSGVVAESILRFPSPSKSRVNRKERPIEDFEIDTLVEGFTILGELEELLSLIHI